MTINKHPANKISGLIPIDPRNLILCKPHLQRTAGIYNETHEEREQKQQRSRKTNFDGYIHRITIIGNGAAGKTTLSKKLANITGLPVIHLDKYYWKGWQAISPTDWKSIHSKLINEDRWIIEGTQPGRLKDRLQRSDLVVFLDTPTYLCLYRFIKKYLVNKIRKQIVNDGFCYEKFSIKSLRWIYNYNKDYRAKILTTIDVYKKPLKIIRAYEELERLIKKDY